MTPEKVSGSPLTEMLASAAVVHQQAIERLSVPALIIELPSRRIHAANQALADLVGTTTAQLLSRPNDEVIHFENVEGMLAATADLATGAIDGYRARRRVTAHDGSAKEVLVWCRLVEVSSTRYAACIVTAVGDGVGWQADPPVAWAGPLAVGMTDANWRLECVSSDINDLIGIAPMEAVGRLLLEEVHPDDVGGLMEAARTIRGGGIACMRRVRLRRRDGTWLSVQFLLDHVTMQPVSPLVFALLPEPEVTAGPPTEWVGEMERRLRRVASELHAAGMMDDIQTLPSVERFPQIATLTSRQWHILVRLLHGERVPAIAAELHVSPSTLRNQLSAMFERFGVHSQAELINLLRRR